MEYRELIADFAAKVGLEDFSPNEEGVCQLIDENMVITIQDCEEIGLILITAPMAKLPARTAAVLLRRLLAANFLYEKTMGATIALDEKSGMLYLTRYDALGQLDGEKLKAHIESFATVLDQWQHELVPVVLGNAAANAKSGRKKALK